MKIKLDPGAYMPERAHSADAGLDLRSPRAAKLWFFRRWAVIDTGVHVEIPKGYVGLLLAKSGLNTKRHIRSPSFRAKRSSRWRTGCKETFPR